MISLENVSIRMPIFGAGSRSLKNTILCHFGGKDVHKTSDVAEVPALTDITLSISEGERVGLVGSNGAGKTTLLRTLAGIYPPCSGKIATRGSIGSLLEIGFGLDSESTGRENIVLKGALMGMSHEQVTKNLDQIIEFSGLGYFADLPVRTYSSGMIMRLNFSLIAHVSADILLMDEWLTVGDTEFKNRAARKLDQLVNESKVLVLATHSKETLLRTCTRAIVLRDGRVVMDGTPREAAELHF